MSIIEINWRPASRDLRLFAIVQLAAAGGAAWFLRRQAGWDWAAAVLVIVSLGVMITGLVWPSQIRYLFLLWMLAAFPVGWVMAHVSLAVIYFGIVTPIGLALRMAGHDPLQLKKRPGATTYWIDRPPPPEPRRYFRQF